MSTTKPESPNPSVDHRILLMTGRKLKKAAAITVAFLALGFFGVHYMKSVHEADLAAAAKKAASAPPAVDVITVQNAPSSLLLTLPGETAAWYESTIYARVNGYVAQWNADIGDHVRKGQVLASIETPDLDAELVAAQAKQKAAQALVVARSAEAEFAKTTYQRWKGAPKGVVSDQERDAKRADYDSAVARLSDARAQVDLAAADVDRYTVLKQFKQVKAPYDGIITERHIDIGNLVTAGSTASTTPLYRMEQDNPIRVLVDVPQSAANDIKIGAQVQTRAGNIPDHAFSGKVTRTADAINPQTRTLQVEADIPNAAHMLVPGMYVNVDFQISSEGLTQVPAAAVMFRSDGPRVGVIGGNNRVAFRKITIARDDGNTVELRSGVTQGERVALNISSQIAEGDTVEVHEIREGNANAPVSKP